MPVVLGRSAEPQFEFTMTIRAMVACLTKAATDLECETQFGQFMRHADRTAASFLDSA
jgi:hypothetical protein